MARSPKGLLDQELIHGSDDELVSTLRDRLARLDHKLELPDEVRALRELFALDDEVRNGGFAQYFFNPSCLGAIDAWFASADVDTRIHALVSRALLRLGEVGKFDLDLAAMVARGGPGSLMPAMRAIVGIQREAQGASKDPRKAFQQFAERCDFHELDDEFFDTDLGASAVVFIRRHADVFTAPL